MPAPRWLARVNRRVTNRVLPSVMRGLPGFALVHHVGRVSGRDYRTPVLMFAAGGRYLVALTYGPTTDWVRNVVAAGRCMVEFRGRLLELGRPRIFRDPTARSMPRPVAAALRLLRVVDFLELVSLAQHES